MVEWSAVLVVALVVAGFGAGFLNAVVGSGTLLTFPTLLFFGVPALPANITNSVGLVPGGVSSILGYRAELRPVLRRLPALVTATALGALTGALLLLVLPPEAFRAIVPVLIALSLLLVAFGPRIQAWTRAHHGHHETPLRRRLATAGIFVSGMYGAYFGAAQGVLMIAIMNILLDEELQPLNALKNVLGLVNNALAVVVFLIVRPGAVIWPVAGVLAVGTVLGAYAGARVGRRLSPAALRTVIVVVGVVALVKLLVLDR